MLNFGNYQTDTYKTRNGSELQFVFFGHASLAVTLNNKVIYVDPTDQQADMTNMPKADVVIYTHHHDDHFDLEALKKIVEKGKTVIVGNDVIGSWLGNVVTVMKNGDKRQINRWLTIEAVAAYNTTPAHSKFHPKGRDNGYILSLGGERIYIAGDTEPTPEMEEVTDIDYAFLPVNQPYTMTVEQAADAASIIKPRIFYPYHYGGTEQKTDLKRLELLLTGSGIEVKIRKME